MRAIAALFPVRPAGFDTIVAAAISSNIKIIRQLIDRGLHFDSVCVRETDGRVNPLMAAMGPNVAGVIGSAVAAGEFLALLS